MTGVDFSSRAIQEAQLWAVKLGVTNVQFRVADVRIRPPRGGYDAVIDTQTLWPGMLGLRGALAQIRAVLQADGISVSVPPLGTANEAKAFLAALRESGFTLRRFDFIRFQDLGQSMAYPVIEADLSGSPGIEPNLEELYSTTLLMLERDSS